MEQNLDFLTSQLLAQEESLQLVELDVPVALKIGEIARLIGVERNLPIAIEVRIGSWLIYHVSLPGSSIKNQEWLDRKARVVQLKHHSTFFERVSAQERGINWHDENCLPEELYAIHGGGIPLITKSSGLVGCLLISGLPQLEDHLFGVEVLKEYLAQSSGAK